MEVHADQGKDDLPKENDAEELSEKLEFPSSNKNLCQKDVTTLYLLGCLVRKE